MDGCGAMNATEVQAAWCRLLFDIKELEKSLSGQSGTNPPVNFDPEGEAKKCAEKTRELLTQSVVLLWPVTDRLEVNAKILAAFFVCKIWQERMGTLTANTVLGGAIEGVGIAERVMFCKRLATVVLLAFGQEPDFESLRSLLWLVCEYGHEGLGLDRRIDLEKHLGLAAMEQPALYGLTQFYRDHLNHVIQVCLLGWLLLETNIGSSPKYFWEIISQRMGNAEKKKILQQWFVASLLHDVGYAIEVGKGWASLMSMFENPSFTTMREDVLKAIQKLRSIATNQADWNFRDEDEPEHDHGVASAIHTKEMVESLSKNRPVADLNAATLAMAHHNHWHARINFDIEPLTAWLVICDEVQEWDRPWLSTDRAGLALTAAVLYPERGSQLGHEDISKVLVNIKTQWSDGVGSEVSSSGDALEFEIQYTPEIHRQYRIFSAWVGRSASLQRLGLSNAGFDVRFRLISKIEAPEGLVRLQPWEPSMERLRRLVREEHLGCVFDWLPKPPGTSMEQGVKYLYSSDAKTETLQLSTGALGKNPPIAGNLEPFWKAAAKWSGSHESREPDE